MGSNAGRTQSEVDADYEKAAHFSIGCLKDPCD